MTGLVGTVRGKVNNTCIGNRGIKKEGCSVSLKDAPQPRLIIDFDKPGAPLVNKPGARPGDDPIHCDYLFVAEVSSKPGWVVPLELKNQKKMDASEVVGQLKAGARSAEQLVPNTMTVNFRPVVAFSGGIRKDERNALKANRNKVRFHGTTEPVRLIKCGDQLTKALGA